MILMPCSIEEFEDAIETIGDEEREELGLKCFISTRYEDFGATYGPTSGLVLYNAPEGLKEEEMFAIIDAVRPDFSSDFVPNEELEGRFEEITLDDHPELQKYTMVDAYMHMFLTLIVGVAIIGLLLK